MVDCIQRLIDDDPAFPAGVGGFIDAEERIIRILLKINQPHLIFAYKGL